LGEKALLVTAKQGWLTKGALIVWEDDSDQIPPTGFSRLEARQYGQTWITFLTYDAK